MFGFTFRKGKTPADFKWKAESPLAAAHELLERHVREFLSERDRHLLNTSLKDLPIGREILRLGRDEQVNVVDAAIERLAHTDQVTVKPHLRPGWETFWLPRGILVESLVALLRRKLPLEREHVARLLNWICDPCWREIDYNFNLMDINPVGPAIGALERFAAKQPIEGEVREAGLRVWKLTRR